MSDSSQLFKDDEKEKLGNPSDDELRHITGIGHDEEGAMDREAHSGAAEDIGEREGLFNKDGDKRGQDKSHRAADAFGKGASAIATSGTTGRAAKVVSFFWGTRRRKQATVGGSLVGGGIAAGIITAILMLLPLKIVSIMQDVENHFFASSEQATADMTEKLMQNYIVKKVMPGMVDHKCNSTRVTKSCALVSSSKTPVGQLYNAWRTAKFENKLYDTYGIEIIKDGNNNFYFRSDNLQHRIFLGEYTAENSKVFDNKVFTALSKGEIRTEMKAALSDETLWKQVMLRFKVGKLLENKYKILRCVMTCKIGDKIQGSVDAKKNAFKSYLNKKVIAPRNQMYSLAIDCALSSFECTKGDEVEPDGGHTNEFDRSVQTSLSEFSATDEGDLNELFNEAKEVREKGITGYLVSKVLGDTAGELTSKAIPIIGWINLAAQLSDSAQNASSAIRAINYTMYANTAIETYMLYRSTAGEIKSGNADATVVGSIADSLDASKTADQGGLSAEQTRLYQSVVDGGSGSSTSLAASVFPTAAAATTSDSSNLPVATCNDGSVQTGIVCPELIAGNLGTAAKVIDIGSQVDHSIFGFQKLPAHLWMSTIGWVFNKISSLGADAILAILKHAGFGNIINKIADFSAFLTKLIVNYVFPMPLGNNPSGGRNFEVAAAGADFAANDFAHYRLGGEKLSPQQLAAVQERQQTEEDQAFASQPLFARVFNTNNSMSFVSRLALAMPNSLSDVPSSFLTTANSLLTNPFGSLGQIMSSVLGVHSVGAAAATATDPFGITQYGVPDSVINSIGDPETYQAEHCQDVTAVNEAWGKTATLNPVTQQYENTTVDKCQIIQTAVASAGCLIDPSLDPDCSGTDDTGNTSAGGGFRIASYNVKGANDPGGGGWQGRMNDVINVLNNENIDIAGMQEFEAKQKTYVMGKIGDTYESYPKGLVAAGNESQNSIIWNKSEFKLIKGGVQPNLVYFGNNPLDDPYVELQQISTGQDFYVLNTHDPADAHGCNCGSQRDHDAHAHAAFVASLKQNGLPIFFTGDFNSKYIKQGEKNKPGSGDRNDMPYCTLTANGLMWDAKDALANRTGHCPLDGSTKALTYIPPDGDHIFMTTDVSATSYLYDKKNPSPNGSDHPTLIVDVVMSGAGT